MSTLTHRAEIYEASTKRWSHIPELWWRYGAYVGCLLLFVAAASGAGGTLWLYNSEIQVSRAYDLQTRLERLMTLAVDAETGQRGYVITGQQSYLRPYLEASQRIDQQLRAVQASLDHDIEQQNRFAELKRLLTQKHEELAAVIDARERQGVGAAMDMVTAGTGKQLMDCARLIVGQMEAASDQGLSARRQRALLVRDVSLSAGLFIFLLTASILATFLTSTRRVVALRLRAAERTSEALRLLETVISSVSDPLIVTDDQGIVTRVNRAGERLLKEPEVKLSGRHIDDVLSLYSSAGDRLGSLSTPSPWAAQRTETRAEMRLKDGRSIYVERSAARIIGDGVHSGAVVVLRDVTDQKNWEDRITDTDRRKSEFISVLSHELRNPLAAVRSAVDALPFISDPEESRKMHGMADRQLRHMVRMIDDLLDVSRLERGSLQLKLSTCDINRVVRSAIETVQPLFERRRIRLIFRPAVEPCFVVCDFTRLVQVIANLLSNAAKFSPLDMPVEVNITTEQAEALSVKVRDHGIGLSPSNLERIFEMFQQVDVPAGSQREGLGVGLGLARQIVALHGGSIEAASEGKGTGSEFIVRLKTVNALPLDAAAADAMPHIAMPHAVSVLVVDDNQDAADGLATVLGLAGFTVSVAYDGTDALVAADSKRPDVVLLDIGMPGLSGYDVARRLREQGWSANLIIVAVTGWGQESDQKRAIDAGFDMHFTKPVDHSLLQSALLGAIAAASAHGPDVPHTQGSVDKRD